MESESVKIHIFCVVCVLISLVGATTCALGFSKKEMRGNSILVGEQRQSASVVLDDSSCSKLVSLLERDLSKSKSWTSDYLHKVIQLLNDFRGRSLDTTVLVIGNVGGTGLADTIFNRVFERNDTVIVRSWWNRNGENWWHDSVVDPKMYLESESRLFDLDTRNIFITFAVGVIDAPPKLSKSTDYPIPIEISVEQGMRDLKELGIEVSPKEFRKYLEDFKGNLIEIGDPFTRESLMIWYRPVKRFITYYEP